MIKTTGYGGKIPMKLIRFSLLILIMMAYIPRASALEASYAVMPERGSSTQPILIWVRVDPLVDTEKMYLYVFWDTIPLKVRIPDLQIGKTVNREHRWDITINPPVNNNYLGKHKIKIWIETASGDRKELNWEYRVTSGLPPLEWWENLPQALLDEIRGFTGEQGLQGEIGIQGEQGEQGVQGEIGIQGEPGVRGLKGDIGERGLTGKSPNFMPTLIVSNMVTCVVAIAVTLYISKRINDEKGGSG